MSVTYTVLHFCCSIGWIVVLVGSLVSLVSDLLVRYMMKCFFSGTLLVKIYALALAGFQLALLFRLEYRVKWTRGGND